MSDPLRVTSGDHWIELRNVEDLTYDDQENFDDMWQEARLQAQRDGRDENGKQRMVISADGVTMVPVTVLPVITSAMLTERQDRMLGGLVTGWSFTSPSGKQFGEADLPYTAQVKRHMPRALGKALENALAPYYEALTDTGPKETTEATSASVSS